MNILKNKHLILAMFVAPVLAIIAYFSVDHFVSEKPSAAKQGATYKLVGNSNCRYQSGLCTLRNGDIELVIRAKRIDERTVELVLSSELEVEDVLISLANSEADARPVKMQVKDGQSDVLHATFDNFDPQRSVLRLAAGIAGSTYYAETTAVFVDYETSFSRDNFSQE